ncbi:MAG: hypothetical protein ACLFUB_13730 [Cyclobacteriaceae bacterium]
MIHERGGIILPNIRSREGFFAKSVGKTGTAEEEARQDAEKKKKCGPKGPHPDLE